MVISGPNAGGKSVTMKMIGLIQVLFQCAQVGMIKNAIKDAILDGVIQNNEDEAVAFMHSKAQELGLKKN